MLNCLNIALRVLCHFQLNPERLIKSVVLFFEYTLKLNPNFVSIIILSLAINEGPLLNFFE